MQYIHPWSEITSIWNPKPKHFLPFFTDICLKSALTKSSETTEIESKHSLPSDTSENLEISQHKNYEKKHQNSTEKPKTSPKPKMLLTKDGRLKPMPPPRPR